MADNNEIKTQEEKVQTTSSTPVQAFAVNDSDLAGLVNSIKDDDAKAIGKLLLQLNKDNERREKLIKMQFIASICSAALVLILVLVFVIAGFKLAPTVNQLAADATTLINNTDDLIAQAGDAVENANETIELATEIIANTDEIIANLEATTSDLANVKIEDTVDNVNDLLITSGDNITSAFEKVDEIDVESLNQAIKDLQGVIEPLSRLFKK